MSKFQKIALGIFVIVLAVLVYSEANRPEPVNWYPSYNKTDKIPFGTKVFYELLKNKFGSQIIDADLPPYIQLDDTLMTGNYIFINNSLWFDDTETDKILAWVEKGNNLFLSSGNIHKKLSDTLGFNTLIAYNFESFTTKPLFRLTNRNLNSDKVYLFDEETAIVYFDKIDTLNTVVLGETQIYRDTLEMSNPLPNFIKINFGKGAVFVHCFEETFTNYFILHPKNYSEYTENVLAYINDGRPIYLDSYYKTGKPVNISPLRVILLNKHLKWAYYTVLIGCLLFVFFEGKRKQRVVPILTPNTNKTYEYTQTIAGLYLENRDNHEIARKQIALFLEYIRTRHRIPTENLDERFFRQLASVSDNDISTVKLLFEKIKTIRPKTRVTNQELEDLYNHIQEFKNQIDGKSRD